MIRDLKFVPILWFVLFNVLAYIVFALLCVWGFSTRSDNFVIEAGYVFLLASPLVCLAICVVSGIISIRMLNNLYLPVIVNAVMCGLMGYICLDGDFRWTLMVAMIAGLASFVAAWVTHNRLL